MRIDETENAVTGQADPKLSDREIELRVRDEGKQPFFRDGEGILYVRPGERNGENPL